jgi:hypothetical protein
MWRDAIDLGVSCCVLLRAQGTDAVYDRLLAVGVEPWLAARLTLWLPLAFGRRLYPAAPFGDAYVSQGRRFALADDPLYAEAVERAARATPDELEALGAWSSEVRALRAASGGPPGGPADVQLTEPALVHPLAPVPEGSDGGVLEPWRIFAGFLDGHGIAVDTGEREGFDAGGVSFDARVFSPWRDGLLMPQVDFIARSPRLATGYLCESFAGMGATYAEAMVDALRKFERGSLHVMVAALLDRGGCAEQVSWETWAHPSGDFDACLGAQLALYATTGRASVGALVDALRDALAAVALTREVHALRLFRAMLGERVLSNEVLLDGASWPDGERLCDAHGWPRGDALWGTRLFVALVPTEGSAARR